MVIVTKREYDLEKERLKREFFDREDGEEIIIIDNIITTTKNINVSKENEKNIKAEALNKIIDILLKSGLVTKKDVQ